MVNDKVIKKNQRLTTLRYLPKEYQISFDFKPTAYLNKTTNIIHLTIYGDSGRYGYRTPGVWISQQNEMYFVSAINGSANSGYHSYITPPKHEWVQVKITQKNFTNRYIFSVDVANINIYSTRNTLAYGFKYVKVYMGDPWYPAQPGLIRNLVIATMLSDFTSIQVKPVLNVSINGQLTNKSFLHLNTTINYAYETDAIVYNLTWQYVLPYFSKILSQSENYLDKGSIYTIPGAFETEDINQYMTINLDMTSCSLRGDFTVEIPLKVSFTDSEGYASNQYSSFKTIVKSSYNLNQVFEKDTNALKESYSRGICWDQLESWIYACVNLYVTTQQTACYVSSNYGMDWSKLDICVGSVLGHHKLTRDLYVIHRNQKTYMMFHKGYERWLAVPNNEFEKNITKNLNFSACVKLEGTYERILSYQTYQWMGNNEGIFFRKSSSDPWTQRIKWKELL